MAPAAAPWRSLFLSSLEKSKSSSFSLASIAHTSTNKPVPRARTVEFRGFFPKPASTLHHSGIDALKNQGIGLNPDIYESDLFSVTTDARMKKMGQLTESDEAVEGVFWFEEVSAQWRVRGRALAVGDPANGADEMEARERVQKVLRVKGDANANAEGDVKEWEWDRQVATYFANHSPVMRGTFKSPPPGTPRSEAPSDPRLKLNQKVEDLKDEVARANFRVLLIFPEEMERLDFSNPDDVRRTNWALVDGEKATHSDRIKSTMASVATGAGGSGGGGGGGDSPGGDKGKGKLDKVDTGNSGSGKKKRSRKQKGKAKMQSIKGKEKLESMSDAITSSGTASAGLSSGALGGESSFYSYENEAKNMTYSVSPVPATSPATTSPAAGSVPVASVLNSVTETLQNQCLASTPSSGNSGSNTPGTSSLKRKSEEPQVARKLVKNPADLEHQGTSPRSDRAARRSAQVASSSQETEQQEPSTAQQEPSTAEQMARSGLPKGPWVVPPPPPRDQGRKLKRMPTETGSASIGGANKGPGESSSSSKPKSSRSPQTATSSGTVQGQVLKKDDSSSEGDSILKGFPLRQSPPDQVNKTRPMKRDSDDEDGPGAGAPPIAA
ncbi:uncharacterized protein DSM5745_08411 [Aspergillus mulundensis]|uniref:Pyridoxamine 5'-phosphate oxidase Alr4036 family FMN-binding domain-containing protein n=1 Tax=Aspergillus mulundensis TaxID=1810919 RepID=A0A3D8RAA4_9EURO|nr:hypothetical protein DSM5745_08411 [Aspergillus mulundensis]RDW70900.1 hypothetical protein DSM5745_08411 [Aspergillus mulundensis]